MTNSERKSHAYDILLMRLTGVRTRYQLNKPVRPEAEAYEIVQAIFGDIEGPMPGRLPRQVIDRDGELEAAGDSELGHHRWHWTLDQGNAARVTIGRYALAVDRPRLLVEVHAQGYDDEIHGYHRR